MAVVRCGKKQKTSWKGFCRFGYIRTDTGVGPIHRGSASPILVATEQLAYPLTVHARDVLPLDLLGAFGLAGVGVGATTKAQFVHLDDHVTHTVECLHPALWQQIEVADLGTDKEHGAGVLARRHAGSAPDAGGGIHRLVGDMLRNGYRVGIGHTAGSSADIAPCLNNLVKGCAVDNKVAYDGERLGPPWLNPYLVTVVEPTHVQLAGGNAVVVAMRTAVDI